MARHGRHRAEHGIRPLRWVAVLGGVLVLTGAVPHQHVASDSSAPDGSPMVTAPVVTLSARQETDEPAERAQTVPRPGGVPRRVDLPDLDVSAPVLPVSSAGGVLTPPDDPQTLGWWSQGARPGADQGSALITGHTVHTGGGALDDLEQLKPGSDVRVLTSTGTVDYAVTEVSVYPKQTLASDAAELFSQTVPGRLVLVTCEDWNGEDYESNVVVVAEPGR